MNEVFRQIPLYRFLMFCNNSPLEKTILDCGAGGNQPPLSLFSEFGYTVTGLEYNPLQIEEATKYAAKKNQALNITQDDMRSLSYKDESFSFVYSYNSVFHMTKVDIKKSLSEMKRVLKKDGLLFVNFLTTKDFRFKVGKDKENNQYLQIENGVPTIHSYFDENETDKLFKDMKIIYKENRVLERIYEGEIIRQGFIDYIVQKI